MVNRHIVLILLKQFFLVVALCLPFSVSSSELRVSVNHNQVELGKPVELLLRSSQASISLDNVDLTPLKNNFHIKSISEVITRNQRQSFSVTLFPRTVGQVSIPEFHFIKTKTQPIPLNVRPAIDPKDNSVIKVKYSVSTYTPWKKQQVLVKMEIISKSAILVLKIPDAYSESSEIYSLDMFSNPVKDGSNELTRHMTGWAIFPRQAGAQQLELPAIQLVRDGITTHRFYPPNIQLDVKSLPVYIPATMPIGRLSFNMNTAADNMILTDTIHNAEFSLKSEGVMPSTLPSIATQLKSHREISFYPARKKSSQTSTTHGVISEDSYSVSFKLHQQGVISLGEFNLNYFDTDSGTIKTLSKPMGSRVSIHRGIFIFLLVMMAASGYFLLVKVYYWLKLRWCCFSGYQQVLKLLPAVQNPNDIKLSLVKIALAENWHDNLTLQQWLTQWSKNYVSPCPININQLEATLYGEENTELDELKQSVKQLCFIRWPLFRFFYKSK